MIHELLDKFLRMSWSQILKLVVLVLLINAAIEFSELAGFTGEAGKHGRGSLFATIAYILGAASGKKKNAPAAEAEEADVDG